jgi:hypothetical protein
MLRPSRILLATLSLLGLPAAAAETPVPRWRALPDVEPAGEKAHTGSYTVARPKESDEFAFYYQKWILERLPKAPGFTKHGYNNWWVYIANTDEDLPDFSPTPATDLLLPEGLPPPSPKPADG